MSSKEELGIGQQRIGHLSKLLTMRDVEGQFWSLTDNDSSELRGNAPQRYAVMHSDERNEMIISLSY